MSNEIEKIDVFISSSMKNEDNFQWPLLRNNISKVLKQTDLFSPFLIEEHTSSIASSEYMIKKVISNDIYILLIRRNLGKGTKAEYLTAQESNKPKLIYFIEQKDTVDTEVTELQNSLIKDDLCLFCRIDENEIIDLPRRIINDLQNDIVIKYKEYISENQNRKTVKEPFEKKYNDYILDFPIPEDSRQEEDKYTKTLIYTVNNEEKKIISKNPLILFYETAYDRKKDLFFVAEPYLGKSTELKALYLHCSKIKNKELLRFFDLSFYKGESLKDLLKISANQSLPYLIFFDGYDEIDSNIKLLFLSRLNELHSDYPLLHFIISSRSNEAQDIIVRINQKDKDGIQYQLISLVKTQLDDDEDIEFIEKVKKIADKEIQDKLLIPYYRTQIDTIINDSSPRAFISAILRSNFDKINKERKLDESLLDIIQNDLLKLSMFLFKKKTTLFTVNEYSFQYPDIIKFDFFQKNNKNQISISRKIFEYFVADYFSKQDFSIIISVFFIKNHIRIETLNILLILISIIKIDNSQLYQQINDYYSYQSPEVFLLGDFECRAEDTRFYEFKSIFSYRTDNKKEIYINRHYRTEIILSSIDNMQDTMIRLLPENKKQDGYKFLLNELDSGISSDNPYKIRNSLSLLLKEKAFYFSENQICSLFINIKSLLRLKYSLTSKSAHYIDSYLIYKWIKDYQLFNNWNDNEFIEFINTTLSEKIDLNHLDKISDNAFAFLTSLVINFYEMPFFSRLCPQIILNLLSKNIEDSESCIVPPSISDSYKIKHVQLLDEVFLFTNIIGNIEIDENNCITILNLAFDSGLVDKLDSNQKQILETVFHKSLEYINEKNDNFFKSYIDVYYKRIKKYQCFSSGKEWTNKLTPENKIKFIEILSSSYDFSFLSSSLYDYTFLLSSLVELLNNIDNSEYSKICDYIRKIDISMYERCLNTILNDKTHSKNSSIGTLIFSEYPEIIIKREKDYLLQEEINLKKEWSFKHEPQLLLNKDEVIKQIIQIEKFVNENRENFYSQDDWYILTELEYQNSQKRISWTTEKEKECYKNMPPFSNTILSFCVECFRFNNSSSYSNIITNINDVYENNHFYRFIYNFFFYKLKDKEINIEDYLSNNIEFSIAIKNSLKLKCADYIKQVSIDDIACLRTNHWTKPLIFYIKYLYTNTIPEWISQSDFDKLICYPYALGSYGYSSASDNNSYLWLLDIENYTADYIEHKCIEYIEKMTLCPNNAGISEMISFLYSRIDNSSNKTQIIMLIIELTKKSISLIDDKDNYPENLTYTLSTFWYNTKNNYISYIIDFLTIENYNKNVHLINYLFDYAIRIMTPEQKLSILKIFKDEENCHEFLCELGNNESICREIDDYINNKDLKSEYEYRKSPFGFIIQSDKVFSKAIDLLNYALEIPTIRAPRREALARIALELIYNHTTKENYTIFENTINNIIGTLRNQDYITNYYEKWKYDMEEKIFSKDIDCIIKNL